MSKYEIKPIDTDTFELHYINRDNQSVVIPFKRTVELAVKLQSVDSNARFKMYEYLTSIGKSKKDLIVERKNGDGTITVDETNYREFEANFLLQEQYNVATEIYKSVLGRTVEEIVLDMNLSSEEAFLFSSKFREILLKGVSKDNIPPRVEAEQLSTNNI